MSFLGVRVYVCYSVDPSHCCVQVIWKRLYKCSSGGNGDTLYQLRNLIQWRNVVNDPSKNMNAEVILIIDSTISYLVILLRTHHELFHPLLPQQKLFLLSRLTIFMQR